MTTARVPAIQLRRAPALEPPYDDEAFRRPRAARGRRTGMQPQLPCFASRQAKPPLRKPQPMPRPRREAVSFDRRSTPRSELPDPRPHARRLAQGLVEVISGTRPIGQLVSWLHENLYFDLAARYGARSGGPNRQAATPFSPPRVASVHVCEPADGVTEASAVVRERDRYYAVTLRLEGLDGRWRCTSFGVV